MSTLTYESGYSLFERAINNAVSQESRHLEEQFTNYFEQFRCGAERKNSFIELENVAHQIVNEESGVAVENKSITLFPLARRFLNALPTYLPSPSVDIDPDGEISFDWVSNKDYMFTVSLGEHGRLSYAGVFGPGKKQHGAEIFDDAIPETVIRCIRRIQNQ